MGKLADIVHQQKAEAIKPAITKGLPVEGEPIFKSEGFSGFGDFLPTEPQINPEQEKMMSIFTIMQMLMKMMD